MVKYTFCIINNDTVLINLQFEYAKEGLRSLNVSLMIVRGVVTPKMQAKK